MNNNVNNIVIGSTPTPTYAYVPPAPIYPTYQQPAPYCTITISNNYGYGNMYGQATLTWYSSNATSATINPYVGSVPTSGSRTVSYGNTTYTMTVWGQGGSATCQTQYAAPIAFAPTTPYVSLSQIPYTGFDFGPVGNALYWISLAVVAIAGAYLVVYFRGGAFAFANSFFNQDAAVRQEFTPALPTLETKLMKRAEATPVAMRSTMADNMSFVRGANGLPQIVIKRG